MTRVWYFLENDTGRNGTKFRGETENLSSSADVLHKTSNLAISRGRFADDGKEMNKNKKMHVQGVQKPLFLATKYANL